MTNLTESSPANPQSGNLVTLTWTDADTGNLATTGGWNDLVTVVNATTGATLYNAYIPYTGASIQPGRHVGHALHVVHLAGRRRGRGQIKVTVTVNANNAEAEYNTAGTAGSNNTSSINFASTLANYADLVVAPGSLAVHAGRPQSGGSVTVTWNDKNQGDAAVNAAFSDYVLVQKVVRQQPDAPSLRATWPATPAWPPAPPAARRASHSPSPTARRAPATSAITVTTDSGQTVKEYDSNGNLAYGNNTASTDVDLDARRVSRPPGGRVRHSPRQRTAIGTGSSPSTGPMPTPATRPRPRAGTTMSLSTTRRPMPRCSPATSITIRAPRGNGTITPGGSRALSTSFTLPNGTSGVGQPPGQRDDRLLQQLLRVQLVRHRRDQQHLNGDHRLDGSRPIPTCR